MRKRESSTRERARGGESVVLKSASDSASVMRVRVSDWEGA